MGNRTQSWGELEHIVGVQKKGGDNARSLHAAAAVLGRAVETALTDRQRACVRLYYYDGLTEEAAARELGLSRSTVCRHLQRARRRLKLLLRCTDPTLYKQGGDL